MRILQRHLPLLSLTGALAALVPAGAQIKTYPYTDLTSSFPAGGQQGTQVTVTFHGRPLSDLRAVRVSGTGVTVRSIEGRGATAAQAVLDISRDAVPGRRSLRVVTRGGISDPAWFVVGQIPEAVESEPNDTPSESAVLTLPVVVNARLLGQATRDGAGSKVLNDSDVDHFRFRARAGETVTLALQGQALDSQTEKRAFLDTTLTIYDAGGQVVARNEDFHTLDPFLAFQPNKDGVYTAEVREVGFNGGDSAVYRLTLGVVPWATSVYPAGGRRGETVNVTVQGPNLPNGGSTKIQIPSEADDVLEVVPVEGAANTRPFVVGEHPEALEQEPNDAAAQANPVTLPAVFNGRLERLGDTDAFQVRLRAGETVNVDVMGGRILRSPVDLTLTVLDPGGKRVAYNDDGEHTFEVSNNRVDSLSGDPQLEFKAPQEGVFTFLIRDAAGRGDPGCVYRATVEALRPRFTLDSFYDNPVIPGPGAAGAVPVQIYRYGGFAGPVRLRVGGLPAGFTGSEAIIPPATGGSRGNSLSGPAATVTITAPANAALGAIAPFWIEGEAEIDGKKVVVRSTPMGHLSQAGDHAIRRRTDTYVACVVEAEGYHLRTETRSISGARGEMIRIPLQIRKLPDCEETIALLPLRGNAGTHQVFTFGPPQLVLEEAGGTVFPFTIPRDTRPGEYTFVLCRPLAGDFRGNVVTATTEPIRLTVTAESREPAGARAGGKQ